MISAIPLLDQKFYARRAIRWLCATLETCALHKTFNPARNPTFEIT